MLRLRLLLTLIIAGSLTLPLQAATITVAPSAADYTSIQAAINAANNGDEIIVSPGTYLETINFNGKAITVRSASGDPADTIIDASGSGTVVTCESGEDSNTVLDGFTITNGASATVGGGMYNYDSSPTVTNCTFSGNTANNFGGGMRNYISSPTVTSSTFNGNTATYGGGMSNEHSSNPTVTNCTFSGNTANGHSGGMHNYESNPTVTNCTFSGNTANSWGGGMYNHGGSATVSNCILWGDSPDEIYNSSSSTLTVRYSDLQSGLPADTVDGGGNIAVDPLFVDADGPDNTEGTDDDNLRLRGGSPCIDVGNNLAIPHGVLTSLDGNSRIFNVVDMGAYEYGVDSDSDGVLNEHDVCPGPNDRLDFDRDGVPDGCDTCPGADDNGPDIDNDGIPDACDDCSLPGDHNCDGTVNLVDLALLALHWLETIKD